MNNSLSLQKQKNLMNTPIKRYSKGMKARLAMSLILSFDPEVLIVDEVLAVGDVASENVLKNNRVVFSRYDFNFYFSQYG